VASQAVRPPRPESATGTSCSRSMACGRSISTTTSQGVGSDRTAWIYASLGMAMNFRCSSRCDPSKAMQSGTCSRRCWPMLALAFRPRPPPKHSRAESVSSLLRYLRQPARGRLVPSIGRQRAQLCFYRTVVGATATHLAQMRGKLAVDQRAAREFRIAKAGAIWHQADEGRARGAAGGNRPQGARQMNRCLREGFASEREAKRNVRDFVRYLPRLWQADCNREPLAQRVVGAHDLPEPESPAACVRKNDRATRGQERCIGRVLSRPFDQVVSSARRVLEQRWPTRMKAVAGAG